MDMGLLREREVGPAEHAAEVECARTAAHERDGPVTGSVGAGLFTAPHER